MRKSKEGKLILEEMCRFKLCEIVGDTLFLHTDPTKPILKLILSKGVGSINLSFQQALRETLLMGQVFNQSQNTLFDTFLSTDNRVFHDHDEDSLDKNLIRKIKELGINRVVFGHSDLGHGNRKIEIEGVLFINTDQSSGKRGRTTVNGAVLGEDRTNTASEIGELSHLYNRED